MTHPNDPPELNDPELIPAVAEARVFATAPADHPGAATEAIRSTPVGRFGWVRFAIGFLFIGLLWIGGLMVVSGVVLPQRLKELGVENPAGVLATVNAFGAVTALVSNLVWGSLSDATRSRFGRRSPWIVIGSLLAGLFLWTTSIAGSGVLLIIVWVLFQTSLNMLIAPSVAVMSDRVPKRFLATVSAFYGIGISVGIQVGIIVGSQFLENTSVGFVIAGVVVAISGILALIIWPKEPSTKDLPASNRSLKDVFVAMRPPGKAPDFWWMFGARFSLLVAYSMLSGFQLYILQDYVGLPEDQVAPTLAIGATISLVIGFVGGAIGGPLADIMKRLKLPVFVSNALLAIGVAMPWIFPSQLGYFLWAGVAGFGFALYNSVDQALMVSVLPDPDKAGKDLGVLNASTTAAQTVGPIITGSIVSITASYLLAFPVAVALSALACIMILRIKHVR